MKVTFGIGRYLPSVAEIAEYCNSKNIYFKSNDTQKDKKTDGIRIRSVFTDSREAEHGGLFIAIKGERVDGHNYLSLAAKGGASAAMVSYIPDGELPEIPLIVVEDTEKALLLLAKETSNDISAKRVAVTGSVGKTTTKEFISSVIGTSVKEGSVYRTVGNFNSVIGMPLSMLEIPTAANYAVLEMGMSALGEISSMSYTASPDVAVITNIGSSHLEYLKTRENIARAKLEIADGLNKNGLILLNGDEPLLDAFADSDRRARRFSISDSPRVKCDYTVSDICSLDDGEQFNVIMPDCRIDNVKISVKGRHNIQAALIAAVIGRYFGISNSDIRKGLIEYRPMAMRQNFIKVGKYNILSDCYNASPESMRAAIDVLTSEAIRTGGRAMAVLGDMKELGSEVEAMHFSVGEYFARKGGLFLVAYGQSASAIAEGASSAGLSKDMIIKINEISDETAVMAAESAVSVLNEKDILLVKASRSVKAEKIIDAIGKIIEK